MLSVAVIIALLLFAFLAVGLNLQPPYIPTRDPELNDWAQNFASLITASPATYGLTPGDAVAIQTSADDFNTALTLAVNPSTRTKPVVADKDAKKAAFLGVARPYAINIKNNLGVTNESKLDLGLNLINSARTPVPAPDSNPLLSVIAATQGSHTIRFSDSNTPDKRSKPFGAIGLQLFLKIGTAPVSNPSDSSFYASVTRQPFAVQFSADDNGKTATYFGRWITRTGLVGPWSPPVSFGVVA